MKKNYKNILILIILLLILIYYLFNNNLIINNVLDYSKLFLTRLFPVSFIFYIIIGLLIDYGIIEFMSNILHINTTNLFVYLISMLSGFPSGSKYTKDLLNKGIIDLDSANKMIMYSHFPNPLFILSSLNMIIKNKYIIKNILISIILSNLIIMIIFSNKNKFSNNNIYSNDFSTNLVKEINNSFKTMFIIYGTSLFFDLIYSMILKIFKLKGFYYIIICGLFDLTRGIYSTIIISNNYLRGLLILLFISMGGISIHLQTKSILADTGIKYKYFVQGRIIGTILCIIIYFILTSCTTLNIIYRTDYIYTISS